jgi:hypothetical protein
VIFFVAPQQETWCMEAYLGQEGREMAGRIGIITFEEIAARQEISLGTYIFAAIDQLSRTEAEIAQLCCAELARANPGITLLNRPDQVLCRYDLLTKCFELKRNTFRVRRFSQFHRALKFPVFIRNERRHTGSLSRLLHTRGELIGALCTAIAGGNDPRHLLIVEYRDTADSSGIFREYCASIVAGQILPQAIVHSRNWVTKWSARLIDADKVREDVEYVERNPHAAWLKETFEIARVQYGRIDYGVKDGVPQVWEINTNPMIVRPATWAPNSLTPEQRSLHAPIRARFLAALQAAFEEVDSSLNPKQTVQIKVLPEQRQRLKAEKRWLQRGKHWDWRTGTFLPRTRLEDGLTRTEK